METYNNYYGVDISKLTFLGEEEYLQFSPLFELFQDFLELL